MSGHYQFQQHMTNIRRYVYLQGQNKRLAWLADRYAEQRFTGNLERQFVADIDANLEDLAKGLEHEDFMAVMGCFIDLSKKHWDANRRRSFVARLDRMREKLAEDERMSAQRGMAAALIAEQRAVARACDAMLTRRRDFLGPGAGSARAKHGVLSRSLAFIVAVPLFLFGFVLLTTTVGNVFRPGFVKPEFADAPGAYVVYWLISLAAIVGAYKLWSVVSGGK